MLQENLTPLPSKPASPLVAGGNGSLQALLCGELWCACNGFDEVSCVWQLILISEFRCSFFLVHEHSLLAPSLPHFGGRPS
jgi:hypothetical protein